MKLYIVGDIEGLETVYQSTIQCLRQKKDKRSNSFMFLGDMYSPDNVNASIAHIENIIKSFFDIHEYLTDESEPIELIRILRDLWKNKGLKSYNLHHIQYWKTMPKQDLSQTNRYFKYKFLFGNKEIKFILDILNSKNIIKEYINGEPHLIVPVVYEDQNTNTIVENTVTFSFHQLNVMISYLFRCYNYCIMNDILFTHCYFNYAKLMKGINIRNIVCGHSRGYGIFEDSRFPGIDIYMIDLTGMRDTSKIEYTNYDPKRLKNYLTINNLNTQGVPTIKVDVARIRPLSLTSLSIKATPHSINQNLFQLNTKEEPTQLIHSKPNIINASDWESVTKELLNQSNSIKHINNESKSSVYIPPCLRNKKNNITIFESGISFNPVSGTA